MKQILPLIAFAVASLLWTPVRSAAQQTPPPPGAQQPGSPDQQPPSSQQPSQPNQQPPQAGQPNPPSQQPPSSQQPSQPNQQQPSQPQPPAASASQQPGSQGSQTVMLAGKIVRQNGSYLLSNGGANYKLDKQEKVKSFVGRTVRVMGTLDTASNTLHVDEIKPSS